jgi:hypothetical protein
MCRVTAERITGSSLNRRLMQNQVVPVYVGTSPDISSETSSQAGTCCVCKCVIPSKVGPMCQGCTGVPAPTYSTKLICLPGANRNCDKDVCIRDMGTWQALNGC